MSKFKHIIWDWNGTLLDDARLCHEIINDIARENNIREISFERYLEIFTFPVREYYLKLGLPVDNGEFERLGKIFIEEYEKRKFSARLHEGVYETLEKIRDEGLGQSVLSAYSLDNLKNILGHFNLDGFFDEITGLDNIYAHGKIDIGKKLMEKLSLNKNEALMIGDTLHDAEVAKEIGADAILIAHGHQSEKRLKASGNRVVNSFDEALKYILD